MMSKKPYRFSKKAGKYISTTKSGNRQFYYKKLLRICPFADFDPNTTYGKYIFSKVISDLRLHKKIDEELSVIHNSILFQIKDLDNLIKSNQKKLERLKYNAVLERAKQISKKENALVGVLKYKAFWIAVVIGILVYLTNTSLIESFLIFLSSYILIHFISSYFFNSLIQSNIPIAKQELSTKDFDVDLIEQESLKQVEISKSKSIHKEKEIAIQELKQKVSGKIKYLLGQEKLKFILSEDFYNSTDWKLIRCQAMKTHKNECSICGSMQNLAVDHVLPRSKYPELALELSNTQILCIKCNSSKGNRLLLK